MHQDIVIIGTCILAAVFCALLYVRYIIWSVNRKSRRCRRQIFPTTCTHQVVEVVVLDDELPVATEVIMVNPLS